MAGNGDLDPPQDARSTYPTSDKLFFLNSLPRAGALRPQPAQTAIVRQPDTGSNCLEGKPNMMPNGAELKNRLEIEPPRASLAKVAAMPFSTIFQHVSQAPTKPKTTAPSRQFDVAELYRGPVQTDEASRHDEKALDEKLRQAYFWIVNNAVISPHYDIEYNEGPAPTYSVGDSKRTLTLPSAQSYSSFILLPLLTFATRRKCLFIGGPGRGKTASAILMGVLAGSPIRDVRRAMQHGHPQMTIADLLGNPLPADLATAQSMNDIRIAWRSWLSMRVKIVDEYNRIPTRTQSALLTVMGDNYAEVPAPRAIGCSLHRIPWSRDVTSRFTSGRCGASASSLPMDAARWERCWSVSSASVSPMCR
jgi:hypothetical protein